jgi:hypothetical protein
MKNLREWRAELKEYDNHLPAEDGEAFKPQTPGQLFNQLKLLQTGVRALAQTKNLASVHKIEAGLDNLINQLASEIPQDQW